jgi:hypothetical protein
MKNIPQDVLNQNNPLQAILQLNAKASRFPPSSRYHGIETAELETPDGTRTIYIRRRFIPQPDRFAFLQEHTVAEGERPDNIAARYLSDPQQFWRICDANAVMDPWELTEAAGKKVRITLPEGIPGVKYE